MKRIVWQTVRKLTTEILGMKELKYIIYNNKTTKYPKNNLFHTIYQNLMQYTSAIKTHSSHSCTQNAREKTLKITWITFWWIWDQNCLETSENTLRSIQITWNDSLVWMQDFLTWVFIWVPSSLKVQIVKRVFLWNLKYKIFQNYQTELF